MAWISGTANNYIHLLELLRNYLNANGYTILHSSATQFYCKGPGLDGLDEIYWGINAFENSGSNYYNWEIAGSVSYREGRGGINHPGSSLQAGSTFILLWNQAIPYWFAVNGRRAILIAKVGTVFQIMYAGLALPFGLPEQYPYPLMIGGSSHTNTASYAATGSNQVFCGANVGDLGTGAGPGKFLTPLGTWAPITNAGGSVNGVCKIAKSLTHNFRAGIVPALDGTYLLDEISFAAFSTTSTRYIETAYCKLDGFFRVSGKNNSAENIISVDGSSYLVVPDTWRSSIGDYYAVKME